MQRDYAALVAYLHARAATPFDWATNSCGHFAAGAVLAQTGRDVLASLPKFKTERGAKLMLARRGGLEATMDSLLTRIAPAHAMRGDVGAVRGDDGELRLVVVEGETLVGPDASGARRVGRHHMVMAWSAT